MSSIRGEGGGIMLFVFIAAVVAVMWCWALHKDAECRKRHCPKGAPEIVYNNGCMCVERPTP